MSEAFFLRSIGGQVISNELFHGLAQRTITAALALANTGEPTVQQISAAAAQNVRLPLESINKGKVLYVTSMGAGTLTMQSNAGVALSPAVTAATGVTVMMFCNGVAWNALSTT